MTTTNPYHKLETDVGLALEALTNLAKLRELRIKQVETEGEMAYAIALPHLKRLTEARQFLVIGPILGALAGIPRKYYLRARGMVIRALSLAPQAVAPLSLWVAVLGLKDFDQAIKIRYIAGKGDFDHAAAHYTQS